METLKLLLTRFESEELVVNGKVNMDSSDVIQTAEEFEKVSNAANSLNDAIEKVNAGISKLGFKHESLRAGLAMIDRMQGKYAMVLREFQAPTLLDNVDMSKVLNLDLSKINTSSLERTKKQFEDMLTTIERVKNSSSKGNIAGLFTSLEGTGILNTLPTSMQKTLEQFAKVDQLAKDDDASLSKLVDVLRQSVEVLDNVGDKTKELENAEREEGNEVDNNRKKHEQHGNSLKTLGMRYTELLSKIRLYAGSVRRLTAFFGSMVTQSSDMIESINLYKMALGDLASGEMADWQDEISKLYLDPREVYQYSGQFFNLAKGLGVAAKDAAFMSKNLTQLTLDMRSYLNLSSNDVAFNKLQSAMAGQTKAVTNVGIAVQKASLDELAHQLGIEKTVSEMTQAEKTYLRYIQIMRSTSQMQGDLGRTIITPTNAIQLAKTQTILFARAIGQVLTPVIMKLLPLIIAATQLLTEFAQTFAKMLGFDLQNYEADTSGIAGLFNDIGTGADTANDSVGKLNRTLAKFDDLNVVESSSAGAGVGALDTIDFSKYLQGYDMLKEYTDRIQNQIDGIKKKLQDWMPVIKAIIRVIAASAVIKFLGNIVTKVIGVKDSIGKVWDVLSKSKLITGIGSLAHTIADKLGIPLGGSKTKELDELKENITKVDDVNKATSKTAGSFKAPAFKQVAIAIGEVALIVGAIAGLTLALGAIYKYGEEYVLNGLEFIKKMAITLAIAIVPFGALAAGCVVLNGVGDAIVPGLVKVAEIIGGFGLIVGAFGALMEIPHVKDFIDTGIDFIVDLANGIGRIGGALVGGLIGGVGEGLSKSLIDVGDNLSKFSESIKPFINNMKDVDSSIADKSAKLAGAIVAFTAAELLAGLPLLDLVMWKGMITVGSQLVLFAPYMVTYASIIGKISGESLEKTTNITKAVTEFANAAPKWGGLKQLINGSIDLWKFGSQLAGFGGKFWDYYTNIMNIDTSIVDKSAAAAKSITEFANLSPKYNGIKQMLGGGTDLWKFGSQLAGFGGKFWDYYNNVQYVDNSVVEKSANAAKSLAEFANLSPKYNGIKQMFSGNDNLWEFGKQLAGFGGKFGDYHDNVKFIDFNVINKSIESLKQLVDIAKKIYDNKLYDAIGKFGDNLTKAGTGLSNFFSKANGESLGRDFGKNVANGIENGIKNNLKTNLKLTTSGGLFGNSTVAQYKIQAYENSGIPKSGEMFFMNENGRAEYMTKVGNKTAVVNQDHMTTALADTITRAIGSIPTNNQSGDIVIYIGNDKVYQGQGEYQSRQSDRYGTTYVKI